jgi:CarD family transcriptional regulator
LGEKREYYVLKPLFDGANTFFVPTFNEKLTSKMFPVLDRDTLSSVIREVLLSDPLWIEDYKVRQDAYREILESGDRARIGSVAKALRERQESLLSQGKKLRLSDESFKKKAEALFEGEIAHVFGITRSEVVAFISENYKINC